jgi:hypothetical protein
MGTLGSSQRHPVMLVIVAAPRAYELTDPSSLTMHSDARESFEKSDRRENTCISLGLFANSVSLPFSSLVHFLRKDCGWVARLVASIGR